MTKESYVLFNFPDVKDFMVDEEMTCLCLEFFAYGLKIRLRVS